MSADSEQIPPPPLAKTIIISVPAANVAPPLPNDSASQSPAGRRPLPFRRLLPLGQLLLCALSLLPFRGVILFELLHVRAYSFAPDSGTTIGPDGSIHLGNNPAFDRWMKAQQTTFQAVTFLNFPGVIFELPAEMFTPNGQVWAPERVEHELWSAVTLPVLALPFWWMAGRGLEALLSAKKRLIAPRLRWFETGVSSLLLAAGLTMAIGCLFFAGPDEGDRIIRTMGTAGGVWAVLGSFTVVAKYLQWKMSRNHSLDSTSVD
jgi:hypothetical protein